MFTFEENKTILLERCAALGMTLSEGSGPGKVRVRQLDPGEVLPAEFANIVRDAVVKDGARVVVIDSLNGYLNAMPEARALIIQLHELLLPVPFPSAWSRFR